MQKSRQRRVENRNASRSNNKLRRRLNAFFYPNTARRRHFQSSRRIAPAYAPPVKIRTYDIHNSSEKSSGQSACDYIRNKMNAQIYARISRKRRPQKTVHENRVFLKNNDINIAKPKVFAAWLDMKPKCPPLYPYTVFTDSIKSG